MEEQSGREFASACATAGAQDAALRERLLRAEIPLSPRRRVQHLRRPTPPHVSSITPRAPRHGGEHVARGRCGRMKIRTPHSPIALFVWQRGDAIVSLAKGAAGTKASTTKARLNPNRGEPTT